MIYIQRLVFVTLTFLLFHIINIYSVQMVHSTCQMQWTLKVCSALWSTTTTQAVYRRKVIKLDDSPWKGKPFSQTAMDNNHTLCDFRKGSGLCPGAGKIQLPSSSNTNRRLQEVLSAVPVFKDCEDPLYHHGKIQYK